MLFTKKFIQKDDRKYVRSEDSPASKWSTGCSCRFWKMFHFPSKRFLYVNNFYYSGTVICAS